MGLIFMKLVRQPQVVNYYDACNFKKSIKVKQNAVSVNNCLI